MKAKGLNILSMKLCILCSLNALFVECKWRNVNLNSVFESSHILHINHLKEQSGVGKFSIHKPFDASLTFVLESFVICRVIYHYDDRKRATSNVSIAHLVLLHVL